jgi:hypothetical protein
MRERATPGIAGTLPAALALLGIAILHAVERPITLLGPLLVGVTVLALVTTRPAGAARSADGAVADRRPGTVRGALASGDRAGRGGRGLRGVRRHSRADPHRLAVLRRRGDRGHDPVSSSRGWAGCGPLLAEAAASASLMRVIGFRAFLPASTAC